MKEIGCKEIRHLLIDWWAYFNLFDILRRFVDIVSYRGEREMFKAAKGILPEEEIEALEILHGLEKLSNLALEPTNKDHPILLMSKYVFKIERKLEKICTIHLKDCSRCRNLAYFIDLYPLELITEDLEEFIKEFWGEAIQKTTCAEVRRLLPKVIPLLFTNPEAHLNSLVKKVYFHCSWCEDCQHKVLLSVQAENEKYRE